ncbi:hypothetical protein WR25_00863 [Diploscapter pachys]|uniref:HTH TFE/IIEalpha-type domain-containing protein n=1 Tax=Diploscapter pachys TaxID=2018661 RepID=A0A2A2JT83_9BILA|nr:hypothetical protein WR25_00863 [Diploscapter pachys]
MSSASTPIASTSSTNGALSGESKIVSEVPPALDRLLLLMVKNFFSKDHFLVVYYILKAVCIREDTLRHRIGFEHKHIRMLLASLKAEKLIKDRMITQKNEQGRNMTILFYFINYRAILNVVKYKIDHMRLKLETKEKDDTQKAHYKCEKCKSIYDDMEIDKIIDIATGQLKCWRCMGEVTQDESANGPNQNTRSLVARFNEQMLPLFCQLQQVGGIQLAPHLLEPDITQYLAEEDRAQLIDFSAMGLHGANGLSSGNRAAAALGGSAHSTLSINYANADTITVNLNSDSKEQQSESAKEVPLWMQDNAHNISNDMGEHDKAVASLTSNETAATTPKEESTGLKRVGQSLHLLAQLEGEQADNPPAKIAKTDEAEEKKKQAAESESDEEEDVMIQVAGKMIPWGEVTEEMVMEMTEEERENYQRIVAEHIDF